MRAIVLAVVTVVIVVVGAVGGSYWLSLRAISASQHNWCAALEVLTSNPVPKPADPKADPSRERGYVFYLHLKDLEHHFNCSKQT